MAVTDQDQLTEIQLALIEDASFSSGLWTTAEVLRYFNQRQYRFLKETRIIAAQAVVDLPIAGLGVGTLPEDWIATLMAQWHTLGSSTYTILPATDRFELDHLSQADATSGATGTPQGYRDGDTVDTLTVVVGPAPVANGEIEILYVSLSDLLDGTGILFNIPDDWIPYLKYGVLADMLAKEGRGQDLLRARYAERRYQEGVALAQALLQGWV